MEDCKIQFINKKMRYKLLTLNNESYILDVDRSPWYALFPFACWIVPHTVYQVDDRQTLEQINTPKVKQTKTGYYSLLGAGISVFLANLLRPVMDYLNISSSATTNMLIVLFFICIVLFFRYYISGINRKNLYKIVNLEELKTRRLQIRPNSLKNFTGFILYYLFVLGFLVLSIVGFIELGNMVILLGVMMCTLFLSIGNSATMMEGTSKAKFK
ncbi:DUF443 family protein [Oceanobacillus halophilus]|uniref:DUF443 family protein n=1 Tax=Oceanobacillus halophilus TaxID=930130 RepID=A0A494ZWN5_9BACI|nr:DUF443 family protein [Oceanobacillus halophilus]RKQ29274.1 DUF443 family protein [Oceanobacillus halophilus]